IGSWRCALDREGLEPAQERFERFTEWRLSHAVGPGEARLDRGGDVVGLLRRKAQGGAGRRADLGAGDARGLSRTQPGAGLRRGGTIRPAAQAKRNLPTPQALPAMRAARSADRTRTRALGITL